MRPVLKWAGGKRAELPLLRPHFPIKPSRVIEPFAGGAAVSWDMNPPSILLNDLNAGLIAFYRMLKNPQARKATRKALLSIDTVRGRIRDTFTSLTPEEGEALYENPQQRVQRWAQEWMAGIGVPSCAAHWPNLAIKCVHAKVSQRIPRIEQQKNITFSPEERIEHLHTAVQASWYEVLREIHNGLHPVDLGWANASWWAVRTLCYSGMFRYSPRGLLNVPYGGGAYNGRKLSRSVEDIFSQERIDFMKRAVIDTLDFEALFQQHKGFKVDDFVFIDPPYDSSFSQYNPEGDFSERDQQRLAQTLLRSEANWMAVVKHTERIEALYRNRGAYGYLFDKTYTVNFRNRNARKTVHLLITRHPLTRFPGDGMQAVFPEKESD